jgi:hypothetical protein
MTAKQNKTTSKQKATLSFTRKLKLLDVATMLFDQECDRMFKRYSVMLTVNIVLIAVLKIGENNNPVILIVAGLFGLILCFCWNKIMVISRHYEVRWQKDMIAIIESDPYLEEYLRGRSPDTSRDPRPFQQSSSFYAKIVIWAIAVLWGGILIYGIFAAVFKITEFIYIHST